MLLSYFIEYRHNSYIDSIFLVYGSNSIWIYVCFIPLLLIQNEITHYNFFFIVVPGLVISYEKTVDYNGYKYRYVVTPTHTSVHWVDFYRAEQECVKWGGHLTSIHSQQELNFVKVAYI